MEEQLKIIALGDVFGRPGRNLLFDYVAELKQEYQADS
jgi:calcineurin-like phosphoesterase